MGYYATFEGVLVIKPPIEEAQSRSLLADFVIDLPWRLSPNGDRIYPASDWDSTSATMEFCLDALRRLQSEILIPAGYAISGKLGFSGEDEIIGSIEVRPDSIEVLWPEEDDDYSDETE